MQSESELVELAGRHGCHVWKNLNSESRYALNAYRWGMLEQDVTLDELRKSLMVCIMFHQSRVDAEKRHAAEAAKVRQWVKQSTRAAKKQARQRKLVNG
jgi:hypothetical protein